MSTTPTRPRLHQIIRAVSDEFNVSVADIVGDSSADVFVHPRQVICQIASRHGYTLPMIGYYLGGRDNTTVLWGIHQIDTLVMRRPAFADRLARIDRNAVALTEAWLERTRTGVVPVLDAALSPDDGVPVEPVAPPEEPEEPLPPRPSKIDPNKDYAAWMRSVDAYAQYNMRKALQAEGAL